MKIKIGYIGVNHMYKLTKTLDDWKLSIAEGFINPNTFDPPDNIDHCQVTKLKFITLYHTCTAKVFIMFALLECIKTKPFDRFCTVSLKYPSSS